MIGHTYFHKVELGLENRSLFERLFSNGLMRLEGQDEPLYVSARLHQTLWPDNADDRVSYQVKVAATPLLFGEFSVAQVISAERIR